MRIAARVIAPFIAAGFWAASPAVAADWPTRPIKMVVTYAPGGSADTLGRMAAQKLTEALHQQIVVENRPGAGGLIGTEFGARAAPDGYTLLVTSATTLVIGPAINPKNWTVDTFKDLTQIALLGGPATVLVVDNQLKVKNLKEFVADAKDTPGSLSYGTAGIGSTGQMVGEMFQKLAGFHMIHVPYKGASQAVADIMGHQLSVGSLTLQTAGEQIRAGAIRPLAITSKTRPAGFPDLPTFSEEGYPQLTSSAWFGLAGPAGLPAEIVQKVNTIVVRGFQEPATKKRLEHDAIEFEPYTPAEVVDFVRSEVERWGPIARESATRPQ